MNTHPATLRTLATLSLCLGLGLTAGCTEREMGDPTVVGEGGGQGDVDPGDPGQDDQMLDECDEGDYEPCGQGGVRVCRWSDWEGRSAWGSCEADAGCTPGETIWDEGFEGICGTHCEAYGDATVWYTPECNTPLVLKFDDAPVRYHASDTLAAAAPFSVADNSCRATDWPTASTPWLVRDLDGNGTIDDGKELFGSGTRLVDGTRASQGFEALSELDLNRDGVVDGNDPGYSELMLWYDDDADRRSDSGELLSLPQAGVTELATGYHDEIRCDERGNCGKERAAFQLGSGNSGEIVDVYLPCRG